jgi:hypothetical protein
MAKAKPVFTKADFKSFAKQRAVQVGIQQRIASLRLTGDKALIKSLDTIAPAQARKGMRTGLQKAVRILAKQMKAQVPSDKKRLKVLIGSRAEETKREAFVAKAGAGVGDAYKKVAKRGKNKRGVGMAGKNIHWLMVGTKQRRQKMKAISPAGKIAARAMEATFGNLGHPTGKVPASGSSDAAQYRKIVPAGFAAGKDAAAAVIRAEITKAIEKAHATKGK